MTVIMRLSKKRADRQFSSQHRLAVALAALQLSMLDLYHISTTNICLTMPHGQLFCSSHGLRLVLQKQAFPADLELQGWQDPCAHPHSPLCYSPKSV